MIFHLEQVLEEAVNQKNNEVFPQVWITKS